MSRDPVGSPQNIGEAAGPGKQPAIWSSDAMQLIERTIQRIAPTQLPVLLTGESGTGKEIAARKVHQLSRASTKNMVVLDCAAIPPALMESEVFGHVKGSFTGAIQDHKGLVVAAESSTLFLDEIGELPAAMQVKLLRLLEDGSYRPVGSARTLRANLRVIAATNRDIADEVAHGRFRSDLFHRLNGCHIHLPPLRERREDILPLLLGYLDHFRTQADQPLLELSPAVQELLCSRPWPGNVRALVNAAHYIASLATGPEITLADLPPRFLQQVPTQPRPVTQGPAIDFSLPYKEAKRAWLDQFEDRYVQQLLTRHNGNVSKAAQSAGMDRRSIQRILKRIRDAEPPDQSQ